MGGYHTPYECMHGQGHRLGLGHGAVHEGGGGGRKGGGLLIKL